MASYKRAIHTVGDYHLVWVLIGHTLQDTDGNFVPPYSASAMHGGKSREGKNVMQFSSTRRVRPPVRVVANGTSIPMTSLRQMIPTHLDPTK